MLTETALDLHQPDVFVQSGEGERPQDIRTGIGDLHFGAAHLHALEQGDHQIQPDRIHHFRGGEIEYEGVPFPGSTTGGIEQAVDFISDRIGIGADQVAGHAKCDGFLLEIQIGVHRGLKLNRSGVIGLVFVSPVKIHGHPRAIALEAHPVGQMPDQD